MMFLVGRYLPDREMIPPCPNCGDRDHAQVVVVGYPAFMPAEDEIDRVYLNGCCIDDDTPTDPWWCPACQKGFPWTYPFERTLLIKEPWVSLVAHGLKSWELRRSSTNVRGMVGLTPLGSGVIGGRADLIDVHGPYTPDELRDNRDKHLIDDEFLEAYAAGKPLFAWEFRDARGFESPAPYEHPREAVIWVELP